MEREIVTRMQEGNQRGYNDPMLVSPQVRLATEDRHPELNATQRHVVHEVFLSREKIVGSVKTTARSAQDDSDDVLPVWNPTGATPVDSGLLLPTPE